MNQFDINLMLALNFDGGAFMDSLMHIISGKLTWIPLYIFMLYMVYRRHGWRYLIAAFVCIIAGVVIADQICNFFKDAIDYPRPTRMDDLYPLLHTVNGYRGSLRGTISGHAATSFCIYLLSAFMVNRKWFTWVMLLYPLLVSYSRIYLGLHFPFQILFGLITGVAVSIGLWFLFKYLVRRFNWDRPRQGEDKMSC